MEGEVKENVKNKKFIEQNKGFKCTLLYFIDVSAQQ